MAADLASRRGDDAACAELLLEAATILDWSWELGAAEAAVDRARGLMARVADARLEMLHA